MAQASFEPGLLDPESYALPLRHTGWEVNENDAKFAACNADTRLKIGRKRRSQVIKTVRQKLQVEREVAKGAEFAVATSDESSKSVVPKLLSPSGQLSSHGCDRGPRPTRVGYYN